MSQSPIMRNKQSGITIIEVLFASVLLILACLLVFPAANSCFQLNTASRTSTIAMFHLMKIAEKMSGLTKTQIIDDFPANFIYNEGTGTWSQEPAIIAESHYINTDDGDVRLDDETITSVYLNLPPPPPGIIPSDDPLWMELSANWQASGRSVAPSKFRFVIE